MERYVRKRQKEPGHQTRDTALPVDNVRSPGDLSQISRITVGPIINAPDGSNVGVPPQIVFSPDGKHIAIAGENSYPVIVQNLGTSPPTETSINAAMFSDNSVYSAVPLWGADNRRLFLLGDKGSGDTAVQWSDGRLSAAWRTSSSRRHTASGQILAARMSPNGKRLVLIDAHGDIQEQSTADGAILRAISGAKKAILQSVTQNIAAISYDTTITAIVLPNATVRVSNIDSGRSHELPGTPANAVAFAQDRLLVERQDNSLEVWNTTGTHWYRSIPSDAIYAHGMTAIPHTQLVARVTEQGTVLGLPEPALSCSIYRRARLDATTVAASPDGRALVTATTSGSVIRWQLNAATWMDAACAAAGHNLTPDEWRVTVGTTPPADLACHG